MATIKIKMFNGTEIPCFGALGQAYYYQGIQRDSITFYFDPENVTISSLIENFTEENCKAITIVSDDSEYVHYNYQIIDQIGTGNYSSVAGGPVSANDERKCLFVRVLQTTYTERLWEQHDEAIDDIVISILEE